jgi:hypothetical protein
MSSEVLRIRVANIDEVMHEFTSLRVERSTTGIAGPYTLLPTVMPLVAHQHTYLYTDATATPGNYYKAEFYNTATAAESEWSCPFQSAVISPTHLSSAQLKLVNGAGFILSGQRVTFHFMGPPMTVEGYDLAWSKDPVIAVTDVNGEIDVPLVQGSQWKVVFEGTSYIREITVPTGVDHFDLLALMGLAPDIFTIAEIDYPAAPRRTV